MNIESLRPVYEVIFAWPIVAVLLVLLAGLMVGLVLYRNVRGMLSGLPGIKPDKSVGKWHGLVDIGILILSSAYLAIFMIGYPFIGLLGSVFDPLHQKALDASYMLLPFGRLDFTSYVLVPLGFSIGCLLDIRRLPKWIAPLPIVAFLYIIQRFSAFFNNASRANLSAKAAMEGYIINHPAWQVITAILFISLLYMLVRAFKPMYRGKKR